MVGPIINYMHNIHAKAPSQSTQKCEFFYD